MIPLSNALNERVIENYTQVVKTRKTMFDNQMEKFIVEGKSISSRSDVKEAIVDYRYDNITRTQLYYSVFSEYTAGVEVLDNLMASTLYVDKEQIIKYRNYRYDVYNICWRLDEPIDAETEIVEIDYDVYNINWQGEEPTDIETEIIDADMEKLYRVSIPIYNGLQVVGFNVLLFNLSDEYDFSDEDIYYTYIILDDELNEYIKGKEKILDQDGMLAYQDDTNISVVIGIDDGKNFVVKTKNTNVFEEVQKLVRSTIYIFFTIIISIMLLMYLVIYIVAIRRTGTIEKSRDEYRSLVYADKLTCARSRRFLDFWQINMRHIFKHHTVMVVDINGLKIINDKYGHLVGDEVIKAVACVLNEVIRSDDYLVRYGGDEFILLFSNICEQEMDNIVKRINKKILAVSKFDFDVNISLGYSALNYDDDFDEKFNVADCRMYKNKQAYYALKKANKYQYDKFYKDNVE